MNYLDNMSFRNIDLSNVYCNNSYNIAQGGMFNSIFGCMFGSPFGYYTPFNGSCKNALGFQLGSLLGSIGMMAANCFINRKLEEKQANSPETFTNDLNEINSKINEQLKKLGVQSTEEAMSLTVEPEYDDEITTTKDTLDNAKLELTSKTTASTGIGNNIKTAEDTKLELLNKIGELNPEQDKNTIEQLKNQVTAKEAEISKLEAEKAEIDKEIDELKKQTSKPDGELYKAYQDALDAKEKRENEIKTAQEALRPLIEKRDAIQAKLDAIKKAEQNKQNNKMLNTADKTIFSRTSEKKLTEKGVFKEDYNEASNLDNKDIAGLLHMYRTGDKDTKKKIQEFFKKHENKLTEDAKSGKSISESIKLIINANLG